MLFQLSCSGSSNVMNGKEQLFWQFRGNLVFDVDRGCNLSVTGFWRMLYASVGTISLSLCASMTFSDSITVPLYFSGSSGMCICKSGVHGDKCDDCRPGFSHFSSMGCQPCQCNNHSSYCHPQSGEPPTCTQQKQQKKPEHCFPLVATHRSLFGG